MSKEKNLEREVTGNPLFNLINRNIPREFRLTGNSSILLGTKDCPLSKEHSILGSDYQSPEDYNKKQAHLSQWKGGQISHFMYGLEISSNYFFNKKNPKFEDGNITFPIDSYGLNFSRGFSKIFDPIKEYCQLANMLTFSLELDKDLNILDFQKRDDFFRSDWYVQRKMSLWEDHVYRNLFSEKGLLNDVKEHIENILNKNKKNYALIEDMLFILKDNKSQIKENKVNLNDERFRNFLEFMQNYEIEEIPKKIMDEMSWYYPV